MNLIRVAFILIITIFTSSCSYNENETTKNKVIIIQPFGGFSPILTNLVFKKIKAINKKTILQKSLPLTEWALNLSKTRYRADSLLHYLGRMRSTDTVVIGLTSKDISMTKGTIKDWGVMGLGYCPGNACIVSTFRLTKKNLPQQFYKVALHELGHTQGLPHCANKTCFMRDAKGKNHLNEETDFCRSCKLFLKTKNWHLN